MATTPLKKEKEEGEEDKERGKETQSNSRMWLL